MVDAAHEQIVVDASPERCWTLATDFERYPEWAKDVKHVAVIERDVHGRGSEVEFRVAGFGRSMRYVLVYDYGEQPTEFSWRLLEGDVLRRLDGRYRFETRQPAGEDTTLAGEDTTLAGDDTTLVTYDLAVDVSVPLPGLVKRRAAAMIMGTALRELKKEAER